MPHIQREAGSFWWKDIFKLKNLFGDITYCKVGDGSSILFWKDNWAGDSLIQIMPSIAQFARFPDMSIREVSEASCLEDIFVIPISQTAAEELEDLRELVQSFTLLNEPDQRVFCWGNKKYVVAKVYKLAFLSVPAPPAFKLVWKSKVTPRIKFFAWLILLDRLNTKSMLARRNFNVQPNSWCVLCQERQEETLSHLFFDCDFAKRCWTKLGIIWTPGDDIHRKIINTRQLAGVPLFMEIILIAAWELWKIRNRMVFDGVAATFSRWLLNFKEEANLQAHRLIEADRMLVNWWLDNI